MDKWKTLARRVVFDGGKWLRVEAHAVELSDGHVIPDWAWVITPDYVNVAVVTEEGKFAVFRQLKYALEQTSIAPVGGYMEPGEEPLETARREVLEETGYTSKDWVSLGSYVVDANRGVGTGHLFLARGAKRVAEPKSDDLEEQVMLLIDRSEIEAALMAGKIRILPWAMTFLMALRYT